MITAGSYDLTVSGSSASLASIVVDSTSAQVTVNRESSITVQSADRKVMTVSGVSDSYITKSCTSSASTVTISIPTSASGADQIVTITPTSTSCSASNSVVSGGSSGGSPPAPITKPVVIPAVVVPGCPPGVTCIPKVATPSTPIVLTSDLSRGSEGAEVTKLQTFLVQDKAIYPEGIVNGTFGPATERAVKRFQAKYGISQLGRVGPATREKIKMVSGSTQATPAIPTVTPATPAVVPVLPTTPSSTAVFSKLLSKGSSGSEVMSLQKILNKDPSTRIAEEGTGSPGKEGDFFGSLTQEAVKKFQVKYSIAKQGDDGYGTVGPKTRAKLNELSK